VDGWSATVREALRDGGPIPPPPPFPEYPFGERRFRPRCVTLHNGMIAPLVPLAVRGCLWYQGESNAGSAQDAADYVAKKQALVADWRRYFGGDQPLPFYFVQLAAWQAADDDPAGGGPWPLLREAQRRCLTEIPGTGMAVANDIGDAGDIHPANKFDVGERLARWALADVYDRDLTPSGPLFKSLRIEGDRAIVSFDHVGEGLTAGRKAGRAPVVATPDEPLKRFAIAGEDRRWRWANARIEGETVVCTHPEVARPAAVRYALHINPEGANLYNRDGLPASPFRTDDW
jgi:sialate O-acetylesterase